MDEKTEELRDIFVEVTDEETVTEQQAEARGSLTDADEAEVESRIEAVIERMRERYDFRTALDDDTLCQVARGFFDGDDDGDIAADLGIDADTAFRARMDLHLIAEDDTEFPFDLAALRRERADDGGSRDVDALAADLDAGLETVERALLVADTQDAVRRVSQRFQSEFEDAIPDAALAVHLTESVTDDGLEEAAEDIETDTKF